MFRVVETPMFDILTQQGPTRFLGQSLELQYRNKDSRTLLHSSSNTHGEFDSDAELHIQHIA